MQRARLAAAPLRVSVPVLPFRRTSPRRRATATRSWSKWTTRTPPPPPLHPDPPPQPPTTLLLQRPLRGRVSVLPPGEVQRPGGAPLDRGSPPPKSRQREEETERGRSVASRPQLRSGAGTRSTAKFKRSGSASSGRGGGGGEDPGRNGAAGAHRAAEGMRSGRGANGSAAALRV